MLKATAICFYIFVVSLFAPFSDKNTEPYKLLSAWKVTPEVLVFDFFDLSQEGLPDWKSDFIKLFSLVSPNGQPVANDRANKKGCEAEERSIFFDSIKHFWEEYGFLLYIGANFFLGIAFGSGFFSGQTSYKRRACFPSPNVKPNPARPASDLASDRSARGPGSGLGEG